MCASLKPWLITVLLSGLQAEQAGLDPTLGLDKYFFDKATAARKTIIGLETAASQIDRFDQMSDALQEQMLRSTLAELDTSTVSLKAIIADIMPLKAGAAAQRKLAEGKQFGKIVLKP